jgi:hypothetical protein
MKHIKNFNEAAKVPLYTKGEIFVFTKKNVSLDTIADCAKQLGGELNSKYEYPDYYLIKTPVGKEDVIGQDFVDSYPEFFTSYERRDINLEGMMDAIDEISDDVRYLDDYIGGTKKYIKEGFNDAIDAIIEKLNKLKV